MTVDVRDPATPGAEVASPEAPAPRDGSPAPGAPPVPVHLETRDFHLWYGTHEALKGVSLSIPPRSVTAIIGPSGCACWGSPTGANWRRGSSTA